MKSLSLSLLLGAFLVGCGPTDTPTPPIETKCGTSTTEPCEPDESTREEILEKLRGATVRIQTTKFDTTYTGTGFLIGNESHIVTNNHVASGASTIKIRFNGKDKMISASPVAYAECADLAVLQLSEDTNIVPLEWHENDITEGDEMAVAGYPANERDGDGEILYVFKEGTISTKASQKHFLWSSVKAFSHSAKISGGNSGGPAIEMETGKVIGINFAGITDSDQNYAISGEMAKDYIDKMIKGESIRSIGIRPMVDLKGNYAQGILVKSVTAGGKASNIGIIENDWIQKLGSTSLYGSSKDILRLERYCNVLDTHNPNAGTVISIEILRPIYENNEQVRNASCKGEINGEKLMLTETYHFDTKTSVPAPNGTTPCPKF